MKRLFAVMSIVCVAATVLAGSMTISTNSVKVIPRRNLTYATAWTNGIALVQGQIIQNNGIFYMAEAAIGSSTNEPTHVSGTTGSLRAFQKGARKACILENIDGAATIWFNVDAAASTNSGWSLAPGDRVAFTGFQNAFYAVTTTTNVTLGYDDVSQ